jgi:divalent metal cation (Fe/Co/Zn/Cd) transporter
VRVLGYLVVRVALFLCVLLALYAVGWRHWSEVFGAVLLSWLIAYMLFGSQHDYIAQLIERFFDRRASRRAGGTKTKG